MRFAKAAQGIVLGLCMVFSTTALADRYADTAHSDTFQQRYGQVRSAPLEYLPTDRTESESDNRALELAVLQHMQHLLRREQPLLPQEQQWLQSWSSQGASNPLISHLIDQLVIKADRQLTQPTFADWQLLPSNEQLYWLSQETFAACEQSIDASKLTDTVTVALALRCREAGLLSQALKEAERSATVMSLAQIPAVFDLATAKELLLQAAQNHDLALVAMPLLAQNYTADEDVQALMVASLYDERIGAIAAVSLAKYGSEQTLLELHRKLQLQQLDSPADRFAKLAIESRGYLLEPLAAQLP